MSRACINGSSSSRPCPPVRSPARLEQLQAENRRLQRELHRMMQQRDILKKTLGIISEPPDSGLNG